MTAKAIDSVLYQVGTVRSPLTSRKNAPRQGNEGAPEAWIDIDPLFTGALLGMEPGDELVLLTWLHLGQRDVLQVRPRNDPRNPITGVFSTRSPDRPNPIGLHRVTVLEFATPTRMRVGPLEAVDGTPLVDIKPVIHDQDG